MVFPLGRGIPRLGIQVEKPTGQEAVAALKGTAQSRSGPTVASPESELAIEPS